MYWTADEPDAADDGEHQEGEHYDPDQDGDDHVQRVRWNVSLFILWSELRRIEIRAKKECYFLI